MLTRRCLLRCAHAVCSASLRRHYQSKPLGIQVLAETLRLAYLQQHQSASASASQSGSANGSVAASTSSLMAPPQLSTSSSQPGPLRTPSGPTMGFRSSSGGGVTVSMHPLPDGAPLLPIPEAPTPNNRDHQQQLPQAILVPSPTFQSPEPPISTSPGVGAGSTADFEDLDRASPESARAVPASGPRSAAAV